MRLRTWPVAALGFGILLLLIVISGVTLSRKAQIIYGQLDDLNDHHHNVDAKLRLLRSDVNLSGIFVRDYLLDVSREHAPEYRERLEEFRHGNTATVAELRILDAAHAPRIDKLESLLEDYWATFEPVFDWTVTEKIFRSAAFLRTEVVPKRDAILGIAEEIEQLNNANLSAQRAEGAARQTAFRADLRRWIAETTLLGAIVALIAVVRLRALERRSDQQRTVAEEAERQTRDLSQRLVAAQEAERKHLSRELHDHVGQVLTGLRMELGRIERVRSLADQRAAAAVAECRRLVDELFGTVRDLALGLRPSMLDDFGLQPALEWLVRDVSRRYALDVELAVHGNVDEVSDHHRTCVYRAIQEALTNCARHARARHVMVTVDGTGERLTVSVRDDGIGLAPARAHSGLGLRGIEERVKELGGAMTLESAAGAGTGLTLTLPFQPALEVSVAHLARG